MFDELKKSIKEISEKMKNVDKKTAIDEYLELMKKKAELEKKLNELKIKSIEAEKNKKERNKNNHIKFLAGGIIAKYYPEILELSDDEKIKNAVEKILKHENKNSDYFEMNKDKFEIFTRDGEECYRIKKQK
jgi:hypothetical protein